MRKRERWKKRESEWRDVKMKMKLDQNEAANLSPQQIKKKSVFFFFFFVHLFQTEK